MDYINEHEYRAHNSAWHREDVLNMKATMMVVMAKFRKGLLTAVYVNTN